MMFWGRRARQNRELAEEIELYLAQEVEDNVARGMTHEQARAAAQKKLGNVGLVKETVHEMNSILWMDTAMQDLRYGLRQLRLSPGFAVTAVLTLALGIGANTAMFELLNAVRLRSLPVEKPNELMQVAVDGGIRGFGTSNGNYDATFPLWEQIEKNQQAFSHIFAWGHRGFAVGEGAQARRVEGLYASGGTFETLGVKAYRGRLLTPADDRRGCAPGPLVISYNMWQTEFGGQDSAIGAKMIVNERPYYVAGVTPPEFFGLEVGRRFQIITPNCLESGKLEARHLWSLVVMGRLKPGWTEERAAKHLKAASGAWFEAVPPIGYDEGGIARWKRFRLTATGGGTGVSGLRQTYERSLWLLLGITGLVLLIACANLANLLLARATAREREIAVRLAIGASRTRLMMQLFSESMLLAVTGGVLGAVLAGVLSRALLLFLGNGRDVFQLDLSLDWRVLSFTMGVALATCLLFGLAPALRSARTKTAGAIYLGARGATAGRAQFRFHKFLIASQIAVSLVLVVGALVFMQSLRKLTTVETGLRQDGVAFHFLNFGPMKLKEEAFVPMHGQLLERVRAIPGIELASSSTHVPLGGSSWSLGFHIPGLPEKNTWSQFTWVSPRYFETMGVPLRAGRDINDHDLPGSAKVVVVNETFVKRFLKDGNVIGRQFRTTGEPGFPPVLYEVIGVVGDTRYDDLRTAMPPIAYAPLTQHPQTFPGLGIVTRSSMGAAKAIQEVKRVMMAEYPAVRMEQMVLRTMVQERLVRERMLAWVSGFFGALAVMLAAIGLYGVLSYMVARRRNEIGIRLALGSERSRIVRLVVNEVAMLVAAGVIVGGALSIAASRGVGTLLFGVTPADPGMLGAAVAVLACIAAAGSMIPAWRAARVNPVVALREE